MTEREYQDLQDQLSRKMERTLHSPGGKYREGYKDGVLSAKSILHAFYEQQCRREAERLNENRGQA